MSDFRTIVELPEYQSKINVDSHLFFVGSCFAENIGTKLIEGKFQAIMNPFGILYNPESIAQCFNYLLNDARFSDSDLVESEGVFHSFYHHSRFSNINKDKLLSNINHELELSRNKFKKSNYVFITFGTAWVFEYVKTAKVVSNCHKLPAKEFKRYRLSVDNIVVQYQKLIHKLKSMNPKVQIVFTVSPVRHFKDGAIENQLSKSTLLLAIHELVEQFSNVSYFPAYEIMMDDLRDYRFYNSDMVHPSPLAVDYIWQRFKESLMSELASGFIQQVDKINRAMQHRPFQPQAEPHQKFVKKQLAEIEALKKSYPHAHFYAEIDYFSSVLVNH